MSDRDYTPVYRGEGRNRRLVEPEWLAAMGREYREALGAAIADHGEIDETKKEERRARSEAARAAAQAKLEEYEAERQKYQAMAAAVNP